MQFICRLHDQGELQRVRDLLRSKGIATYAPSVEPRRMGSQWALFVYLDAQAEDARRIIRDPRHEPDLVVDAVRVERELANPEPSGALARWATVIALTVLVVVSGLTYLVRRFG